MEFYLAAIKIIICLAADDKNHLLVGYAATFSSLSQKDVLFSAKHVGVLDD